jgi:endonuclease/exonuclease/phosphatase family metal-dependent hydrolase
VVLAALGAGGAGAADQTILGHRLVVRNPADATRRAVLAIAREPRSANAVVGNPTAGGAVLEIHANGANPSAQVLYLPPGTTGAGAPLWSALGTAGYRYRDADGAQGPVRSLSIGKTGRATFAIKLKLRGGDFPVDVVPPNGGTDGFFTLTLAGGDRYCVEFGPGARSTNRGEHLWKIDAPTGEGCPPLDPLGGDFLALAYNVAGLPEGLSGSHPETNTPLISPLLNAYDLVLVQESWQTPDPNPFAPLRVYHELLAAEALHPYKSTPAPLPLGNDPRRPSALVSDGLNQFADFAFDPDLVHEMWSECHESAADCLSQKGFSVSRLTLRRGVTMDVYNLHMEAGNDPEDDELRDRGVTELAAFIRARSAGRAVLVGGDFNMRENREPDATILGRFRELTGLTDACAAVGCPETRIDKFMFRGTPSLGITPLSWSNDGNVFVDEHGEPLSDHDPVAVRFAWTVGE